MVGTQCRADPNSEIYLRFTAADARSIDCILAVTAVPLDPAIAVASLSPRVAFAAVVVMTMAIAIAIQCLQPVCSGCRWC